MDSTALREYCLSLPGTSEDIKWGHDLCFLVGEKMFAVTGLERPFTVSLKVPPLQFTELCQRDGIEPAPYLARNHWVLVTNPNVFTDAEWQDRLKESWSLVASKLSKKLQKDLGLL